MTQRTTLTIRLLLGAGLLAAAFGLSAQADAQEAAYTAEFERPYGFAYGAEDRPYEPGTRDANGNRRIVNGRIIPNSSSLTGGLDTAWGQTAGASGMLGGGSIIGNQLNVITNGSFNTVIIDSTQINNGDLSSSSLNGELDLQ
ncbi:MAG: holdfast anchoring protein HfaA [Pseudomonadota bacterium]